jgi:4-amino-4-deoxy-L-arabinose transferase-like glycosyltransferase
VTEGRQSAARDGFLVAIVGLVARLGVVAWAAGAIPPAADGAYYDKLARRLAEGQGYTWLWPDGVVTYAAHYPVGYPAMVALGYALFGTKPVVAYLLNALVGTAAGVAIWSLVRRASSSTLALLAGLAVALHPVLVPYTAAIMTEGVTAALVTVAAAFAAKARTSPRAWRWWLLTGFVTGIATLVRPQSLVLAPVFGALAVRGDAGLRPRIGAATLATVVALAVCAPWTLRNCARMERCALVSVNGGWNLAIGTQTDSGGWQEIAVPEPCRNVFQEAAKDDCFGKEARKVIASNPGAWLARMPAKLRVTFDYFGAAPWYLHTANADRFPYRAKVILAAVETAVSRLLLAAALVTLLRWPAGPSRVSSYVRRAAAVLGLVACALVPGTIAYLALALAIAALGPRELVRSPVIVPATAAIILATAAIHAVFFGAGRYGIIVVPFVTALGFVRVRTDDALAKS